MGKSATTWEGRRALTDNPNTKAEVWKASARELMDINLPTEAVNFFALAGDEEGLREILDLAIREGNFFLFQAAASKLTNGADRQQVQTLITAAEKNGNILYAEKAKEFLNN